MQAVWEKELYFRKNWGLAGGGHVGWRAKEEMGQYGALQQTWDRCPFTPNPPLLLTRCIILICYLICLCLFGKWRWQQGQLDIVKVRYVCCRLWFDFSRDCELLLLRISYKAWALALGLCLVSQLLMLFPPRQITRKPFTEWSWCQHYGFESPNPWDT